MKIVIEQKKQRAYKDILFGFLFKILLLIILSCSFIFFSKPHISAREVQKHLFSTERV